MTLFPLDSVRNAAINRPLEPVLEDLRESLVAFPFEAESDLGDTEAIVEAFDMARPRLNVIAGMLQDFEEPGADISTGVGFLPVLLRRLGLQVTATECDVSISRFARENGIEVREYEIGRRPPFDPGSLRWLVLGEVLEHLKQPPVAVLRELAGLLRPGGTLILSTPNVARLAHIEALVAGNNFLEPFPEEIPEGADPTDYVEHVREYSIREVVEAVEAAGLEVRSVVMTGWGEAGYQALPNPWANEIIVIRATT